MHAILREGRRESWESWHLLPSTYAKFGNKHFQIVFTLSNNLTSSPCICTHSYIHVINMIYHFPSVFTHIVSSVLTQNVWWLPRGGCELRYDGCRPVLFPSPCLSQHVYGHLFTVTQDWKEQCLISNVFCFLLSREPPYYMKSKTTLFCVPLRRKRTTFLLWL